MASGRLQQRNRGARSQDALVFVIRICALTPLVDIAPQSASQTRHASCRGCPRRIASRSQSADPIVARPKHESSTGVNMRQAGWALTLSALVTLLLVGTAFAGPYSRLQVLLPGETAAPGTSSGKTGSANAQTVGVPFNVTVRATDDQWATVATNTNVVELSSSDGSATLPGPTSLQAGQRTFSVTLNAAGTFSILAHDQTDGTIPDGASSPSARSSLRGSSSRESARRTRTPGSP